MTLLAAGVSLPFMGDLVVLFVLTAIIATLCQRFHIVPIVGFLITGVLIGPYGLGLVTDLELVDSLAEIGVILLLFTIGLEFNLGTLARLKRAIILGGTLQVTITIAIVTAILVALGVVLNQAIFTGALVALSSTAIVLGLLSSRNELRTPSGQLSLAILIFQDLAIIGMVLLLPVLGGSAGTPLEIAWTLAKAGLVIGLVLIVARRVVPALLERVAALRQQEVFLLVVVAICFGTGFLTSLAGVSLALGAFLAGLVVSESEYSDHALGEMLPFRTVFNAVFFVSVGMLLDLRIVLERPLLLAAVVLGVLLLKTLINALSIAALRYPLRIAAMGALGLAQIGEFSFVLQRAGRDYGLSPAGLGPEGEQLFIAATVLLMIATPGLLQLGPRLGRFLPASPTSEEELPKLEDHVIIVGYGPAGQHLTHVLDQTTIPYLVLEMNPETVRSARERGVPIRYGDATRPHLLEHAAIDGAKLMVIAINDADATRRITRVARHLNPTLQLISRVRFLNEVDSLHRAGADIVIPEETETSVRIFAHVLRAYMIPPQEIEQHVRELRHHDYELLRTDVNEAHLMVLEGLDEDGLHTRAVAIRKGASAAGETLRSLALREHHGLTVLAVRRDDRTTASPGADFRLYEGDRLVLIGSADQFKESAHLFRA